MNLIDIDKKIDKASSFLLYPKNTNDINVLDSYLVSKNGL